MNQRQEITIQSSGYRLTAIPELGGQVTALSKNGVSILHQPKNQQELVDSPTSFGLPVLFPPNRIDQGRFTMAGRVYQFPINEPSRHNSLHGFLHTRSWKLEQADSDYLRMSFEAGDKTDFFPIYPHRFRIVQEYWLDETGMRQSVRIENQGSEEMPVGLGYHTAFQTAPDTRLRVSVGKRVEMNDRMLPSGVIRDLHPEERRLRAEGLPTAAWAMDDHYTAEPLLEQGRPFHGAILETAESIVLYEVDAFYQHWMIWNAGGKQDFICVEPQNWRVNAPNLVSGGMSENEAGLKRLAPGEWLTAQTAIRMETR